MKQAKYFLGYLFIPVIFLQSCHNISVFNPLTEKGNKQIITEEIALSDYSAINFSVPGEVIYRQNPDEAPYLQIETDENILPLLEISVENNQLNIKLKDRKNINPSQLTIQTHSKHLEKITIAGSGKIYQKETLHTKKLEIKIAGSGNVISEELTSKILNVKIAGSGDVQLNGTADEATFTIAGSGDIQAYNCIVQYLKCKIAGSGDIYAYADKTLDAKIAGSGNIHYKGQAQLNSNIAGSGSIKQIR